MPKLIAAHRADPVALRAVLERAQMLAEMRDPEEELAFFTAFDDVDPTVWSEDAVHGVQNEWRRLLSKA